MISRGIQRLAGVAVLGAVLLSQPALADVSSVFLRIDASTDTTSGFFEVMTSDVTYDPSADSYSWSGSNISIDDGVSQLASVQNFTMFVRQDPMITMLFGIQAAASDVSVVITSPLVSFPTLTNPDAVASMGLTLSDSDGSGNAALTGTAGTSGTLAYSAQYNGLAPGGTVFAEGISGLQVSTVAGSDDDNINSGSQTIAGGVSDMSTQLSFDLSAMDSASGTGFFVIVPEPSAFALLVLGFGLIRRRG